MVDLPAERDLRVMRQFHEIINRLRRRKFVKEAFGKSTELKYSWNEGTETVSMDGPDEEATDAMLLPLRMLIQKKDPVGSKNMATLYRRLPTNHTHKRNFLQAQQDLEQLLDEKPHLQLQTVSELNGAVKHDENLTNRRIIWLMIYGERSHLEPEKESAVASIRATPIGSAVFDFVFQDAVSKLLRIVFYLQRQNALFHVQLTGHNLAIQPLRTLHPRFAYLVNYPRPHLPLVKVPTGGLGSRRTQRPTASSAC